MHRLAQVSHPVHVRALATRDDLQSLLHCFEAAWTLPPGSRPLSTELLLALQHAGNPVLGAFRGTQMVGGSVGVTGVRPDGSTVLHSHMTGVVPDQVHTGVGRQLKWAQRDWARARSVATIEWTFDPLVRRNGWFNLVVLGASAREYLVDFYGPIDDGINAGDETDRLVAVWELDRDPVPVAVTPGDVVVATPDDIVALRRTRPEAAQQWRRDLRHQLAPLLDRGGTVVTMTRSGDYVVRMPQ